jgi:hypothetical protein
VAGLPEGKIALITSTGVLGWTSVHLVADALAGRSS